MAVCFCIKTYVVTPHLNHFNETVQMRGHNIWFRSEIRKIIIKYSLLSRALRNIAGPRSAINRTPDS